MNLAITLIEKDNTEAPNIGTVIFKGDQYDFKRRAIDAIKSHFDCEVENILIQDNLDLTDAYNSPPLDAIVTLEDGKRIGIDIQQTQIY